jgi:hypothetical protein
LLITFHLLRAHSGDGPQVFARPIAALNRLKTVQEHEPQEMVPDEVNRG